MNRISKLIISLIFFLVSFILFLTIPLPFIFNSTQTKQNLAKLNLYQKITPIITERILLNFDLENNFLSQDYPNVSLEIIPPSWVKYFTETIIDELYRTFKGNSFEDLEIDISPIKENYVTIIYNSGLIEAIPEIEKIVPNKLFLTDIFGISEDSLDQLTNFIHSTYYSLNVIFVILLIVFLLIIFFSYLLLSSKELNSMIFIVFSFIGSFFFPSFFFYRFIILSPRILNQIIEIPSISQRTLLIISLSFIDNLTRFYSFIALFLLVTIILLKLFSYLKKSPTQNKL